MSPALSSFSGAGEVDALLVDEHLYMYVHRLRVSLSAAHTTADVDQLADSLDACGLTYLDNNRLLARL